MAIFTVEFQNSFQHYHCLLLHSHPRLLTPQTLANEWEKKKWFQVMQSIPMFGSGFSSEVVEISLGRLNERFICEIHGLAAKNQVRSWMEWRWYSPREYVEKTYFKDFFPLISGRNILSRVYPSLAFIVLAF